jgi:hypothetical protein
MVSLCLLRLSLSNTLSPLYTHFTRRSLIMRAFTTVAALSAFAGALATPHARRDHSGLAKRVNGTLERRDQFNNGRMTWYGLDTGACVLYLSLLKKIVVSTGLQRCLHWQEPQSVRLRE